MDSETLTRLISVLGATISIVLTAFVALKKWKPEVKKMDAETDSEIVEAANLNLDGAKKINQMLTDGINQLKSDLEEERKARRTELQQERDTRKSEMDAEREARRKETEYLRKRIRDAEREARDYRAWAAQLVRQVVEAGKIPIAFLPSVSDESEPNIPTIQQENRQ